MSSIDLMILGLIKAKPRSAYEINRFVEINRLNTWIKISPRAIYRNIRELAKKEYVIGEKKKEGNMPEKMIYSITDKGEELFLELMAQLSSHPKDIYFGYVSFLALIDFVDKPTGLNMLKNLKNKYCREKEKLKPFIKHLQSYPTGGRAVITHYQVIFDSLIQWIGKVIEDYEKEN